MIVAHGIVIPDATVRLRAAILDTVRRHTRMQASLIDITVRDITLDEQ